MKHCAIYIFVRLILFKEMHISLFLQSISRYSFQSLDDHLSSTLICTYLYSYDDYFFWLILKTGSNIMYTNNGDHLKDA